jgi:hypothetical protein
MTRCHELAETVDTGVGIPDPPGLAAADNLAGSNPGEHAFHHGVAGSRFGRA